MSDFGTLNEGGALRWAGALERGGAQSLLQITARIFDHQPLAKISDSAAAAALHVL